MNLNAVILVVGFMLMDLKSMISTLNITEAYKNTTLRFWLVLLIIGITDLPVFVSYFFPELLE